MIDPWIMESMNYELPEPLQLSSTLPPKHSFKKKGSIAKLNHQRTSNSWPNRNRHSPTISENR